MFVYEKKLQYPVRIKNCNPKLASVIISQYGGPYILNLQQKTQYFLQKAVRKIMRSKLAGDFS